MSNSVELKTLQADPAFCSKFWQQIAVWLQDYIVKAENVEMFQLVLLQSLMTGVTQLWLVTEEDATIHAVALTAVGCGPMFMPECYLLHVQNFGALTMRELKDCMDELLKFAREKGCTSMVTMVPAEQNKMLAKLCGATSFEQIARWEL